MAPLPVMIAAAAFVAATIGHSSAATVLNSGTETITLWVTERGERMEFPVAPGEIAEFCMGGCFLTYPGGDMSALYGTEEIVMETAPGGQVRLIRE